MREVSWGDSQWSECRSLGALLMRPVGRKRDGRFVKKRDLGWPFLMVLICLSYVFVLDEPAALGMD